MPIKGLFNRDENNDEINKLKTRIKALELKANSLDVHIRRFTKLENEWRSESFSKKHTKDNIKDVSRETKKIETQKPRETATNQKNLYAQFTEYISQALGPIQIEIDALEDRMSAMETNFSLIKELLEKNQQQTILLKNEMNKMKEVVEPVRKAERSVVIHELKVEKIMLDKYEQNNNIGTIGIKELGGELNIGATYGKGAIPAGIIDELMDDLQDTVTEAKQEAESTDIYSGEKNNDSGHDLHGETNMENDNVGHDAYFKNQQQKNKDDTDGFIDIPIE